MNEARMSVPTMDVFAGLVQSARIARDDRMPETAKRCERLALQLKNQERHMVALCPKGYRVVTEMVTTIVPDINYGLRAELPPFHGWTVD